MMTRHDSRGLPWTVLKPVFFLFRTGYKAWSHFDGKNHLSDRPWKSKKGAKKGSDHWSGETKDTNRNNQANIHQYQAGIKWIAKCQHCFLFHVIKKLCFNCAGWLHCLASQQRIWHTYQIHLQDRTIVHPQSKAERELQQSSQHEFHRQVNFT
jgi:hypothetical protein